jgi:hypothetical protein
MAVRFQADSGAGSSTGENWQERCATLSTSAWPGLGSAQSDINGNCAMGTQRRTRPAFSSAIAGVEACDTQYRNGEPALTRRRTLALRVKPLGLWLILGLSLAPGVGSLLADLSRAGLRWALAILN